MSLENRRFIRFALDIPVTLADEKGEKIKTMIRQISIGGCLLDVNDKTLSKISGEELRLEFTLRNKNKLPLMGNAVYTDNNKWTGIKFYEITQFEQELIADVIAEIIENEGLPLTVNPFRRPPSFVEEETISDESVDPKKVEELEEVAIS
jgi:PilZ domain